MPTEPIQLSLHITIDFIDTATMSDNSEFSPEPEQLENPLGPAYDLPSSSQAPTASSPPLSSSQASQFTIVDDGKPRLDSTTSPLFTAKAFTRKILDTQPPTILYTCMQAGCNYVLTQRANSGSTSKLWKHYKCKHAKPERELRGLPSSSSKRSASITLPVRTNFFTPQPDSKRPRLQPSMFRDLPLRFLYSNNLPLSLVDSPSFQDMIYSISPAANLPSAQTQGRDLDQQFEHHRDILKQELQTHI